MPKITKAGFDSALTVVAATAAAVLPILVTAGDLASSTAAAIGAGVATVVAGYHGGAAVQAASTSPASPGNGATPGQPTTPAANPADPELTGV